MKICELPGFSCRYLVAVLVKYNEGVAERRLFVCSVYLLYDPEDLPRLGSWRNSCDIVNLKMYGDLCSGIPTRTTLLW